ncbi:MAG: DUF4393 domain-containing protein [Candidatus Gastranaerophilales bacterium]|nr:DUF4393 domain-containing protein [Candidatus Gastranaerophilales bacterium]
MSEGLDKLAEGVGKAIETVPDLYDDAFKPAVQESGKTLAIIPQAINAALVPLRQWIAEREYKLAETEKLLAQKLEHVGEDKIVTPEAYVAVPAIQAISYSMDNEELRNLYANLLAKAMNSDTKDQVHPAYVNIISQMTPLDAKILQFISNEPDKDMPIIDLIAVRISDNLKIYITLQPNITAFDISSIELISLSIENLVRNNLISIADNTNYAGYDSIYGSQQYKDFYRKVKENLPTGYTNIEVVPRNCTLSNLGKHFCEICMI